MGSGEAASLQVIAKELHKLNSHLETMNKISEQAHKLELERLRRIFAEEDSKNQLSFELHTTSKSENVVHALRQGDSIPLCQYKGDEPQEVDTGFIGRGQELCPACLAKLEEGP